MQRIWYREIIYPTKEWKNTIQREESDSTIEKNWLNKYGSMEMQKLNRKQQMDKKKKKKTLNLHHWTK